MSNATTRIIARWVHILLGLPIIGYVYSPYEELHNFAWMVRWIFLPVLLLSGLWMWKGHLIQRMFQRK